jgi:hypothetical protein
VVSVAAVVVFGPGLALLLALGVRERLVLLGASPAASVGVAVLAAGIAAWLGGGYGPAALILVTLLLCGVGFALSWVLRRRFGRPGLLPAPGTPGLAVPALAGPARTLAQVLGAVLVLTGAMLTLRTWVAGLGSWSTWNQDHDTILHALLTAYIMRTGRGAPWQIMPADVIVGTPTVYYPDGFHLVAATIADLLGGPDGNPAGGGPAVVGMNAAAAMLLGVAWTASAGALAGYAVRRIVAGPSQPEARGWTALGAGVGAMIAAGMFRPGVALARGNGLLPNASALVLVPGVMVALLMVRPRGWAGGLGVGVACAGVVAVHPSSGLSVGLSVLVIWLGMLCTRLGRGTLRAQWPVLVAVLGAALLAGAPVLHGALAVSARIEAFPPDSAHVPIPRSLGGVLPAVYGGMFDDRSMMQVWPTLLMVIGIGATLVLRRAVALMAAWLVWVVVVELGYRNPHGITAPLLGFFYNSVGRVQEHTALFVPALATVGVFALAGAVLSGVAGVRFGPLPQRWADRLEGRLGRALTRPSPGRDRFTRAAGGLLGVLLVFGGAVLYLSGPTNRYLRTNAEALSQRWRYPQLLRVDHDDVAAAAWLRGRIKPGQRIMNSPNDGSTYLYVHDGMPIVELSTLGVPGFPYTWQLMKNFQDLAVDHTMRDLILRMNIAWVYVDSDAPIIGAYGAPDNWTGGGLMTLVPGLTNLDSTPGLVLEHVEGSVRVYAVDRDEISRLDTVTPRGGP